MDCPHHGDTRTAVLLTREDDREEEKMMNCQSIQREGKTTDLYMKEREGKPNADYHSRRPMPNTSAEPYSSPWGQTRAMGAGEADGGRRGWWGQLRLVGAGEPGGCRRAWWGQARPMGAISHRPHARARQHRTPGKPLGQIPSKHSLFGPRLSRRNKVHKTNNQKSKILL